MLRNTFSCLFCLCSVDETKSSERGWFVINRMVDLLFLMDMIIVYAHYTSQFVKFEMNMP